MILKLGGCAAWGRFSILLILPTWLTTHMEPDLARPAVSLMLPASSLSVACMFTASSSAVAVSFLQTSSTTAVHHVQKKVRTSSSTLKRPTERNLNLILTPRTSKYTSKYLFL